MTRPRLLFYCQHSVGLGHLVRSVHLVEVGRRGRVDVAHPGVVERRALPREPEQRPETFGPVALDPPLDPEQIDGGTPDHVRLLPA